MYNEFRIRIFYITYVLELVDGADLRFAIFICKGSSPFVGNKMSKYIIIYINNNNSFLLLYY